MECDVIVLGAGGAGIFCAIEAARRGKRVVVLDHARKVGGKILISGGGRCNFTNLGASPKQYSSENSHFCKSALSRFTPSDFIERVKAHGIGFHEKKLGQLFCDDTAQRIVDMLVRDAEEAGVQIYLQKPIGKISKGDALFTVRSGNERWLAPSLVVATGGLSIPKLGASALGYELAKQFGLKVIGTAPALDGFTLADEESAIFDGLAGVSTEVEIEAGGVIFKEALLMTHRGLSGPAALQASLYWRKGADVRINWIPQFSHSELIQWFHDRKNSKQEIKNILSEHLPKRLVERLLESALKKGIGGELPLSQTSNKSIEAMAEYFRNWRFHPSGTVGYSKAEVTRGGVCTDELSSKTMESKKVPGLYFVGEVVDVTGWLGGYNFQWAWASGWAAGQSA